ncbi:efflux RND transporter permease subunit [Paenibacillus pinistramenti]|uniref:efflux RND transporter permease subunit n=1 Tax=Paenibacillus pinistramenti TaxID=1768003 RepID=UPI001108332E|nr:efflux RND transporter permease subunit [Paenibacillus pinistramenti]
MKGIINFSLRNKFAIWFLTIIVVAAGLYSGLTMKQETIPNISIPYLTVTTVDPGAAPEGVQNDVTVPLEQKIRNLEGVKNVNSTSMENASSITVEYDYGADLDNASAALREAITSITLPDGVQKPQISRFSLSSLPVISLSIASNGSNDLEQLTRLAENDIQPELEDLDGVASVQIAGQYTKNVELTYDTAKMAELGLTEDTVQQLIQASSVHAPLGLFELDKSQKAVVVDGNITTLDDLKKLEIPLVPSASSGAQSGASAGSSAAGAAGTAGSTGAAADTGASAGAASAAGLPTITLDQIAKIEVTGEAESVSRTNGKESLGIQIVKTNDANTVDVVNEVKDTVDQIKKDNPDLDLTILLDQGKPIEDSVNTMLFKALFGALFAVLIIMIFLRNLRSTIIAIISIPLSLLIAILALRQMDITLNMMSLGAMTVAIGRVVDDSIVVIENIYRRMSLTGERLKGRKLILEATREMFIPIASSTIVTIAVFLPLAFVSGMVGELFMPFALTMVFALLASLLVAVTLVPALAHTLFRNGLKKTHDHEEKPGALARSYKRILGWSLSHKLITFVLALVVLLGSLVTLPFLGKSFLPDQEDKYVMVTFSPEAGDTLEEVKEHALAAEKIILAQPDLVSMQYSVGGSNPLSPGPSKSALFYANYESDTKNFDQVKEDLVAKLTKEVPYGTWSEMNTGASGGLGGSQLTVQIFGDSIDQIKPFADQILQLVQKDTADFEKAESSLSQGYDQYTLLADQAKLSSLGLTAGQMAMALAPVTTEPVLTTVDIDDKEYEVHVKTDSKTYSSISDIENQTLTSPLGIQVPIKEVAKVEQGTSPDSISSLNGKTVVEITANILAKDVSGVSKDLEAQIDDLKKPEGVTVEFGGVTEQINDTFTQLGLAMGAAIAIVYFVLVVTFGGALAPFAILFSLPFTVIGALIALLISGDTLNVSSLMGGLMLIGIVVTNAIVLIDRVIHKEREGLSTREALLEAGATRLRPILMTAIATIGALLPLVFGWENSAGVISKGLGVTVIGGLVSSTLLTLVIVPVVYEFLAKFRRRSLAEQED